MGEHPSHPSFLELDRLALGVSVDAASASHVRTCETCQSYLARLTSAPAVPGWVRELSRPRPARVPAWSGWRWMAGLASAAAAVAVVVLLSKPVATPEITAKGSPAIGVYIKREGRVWLWDGTTEVVPGDTLRLKVIPSGFRHLTVLSPAERGAAWPRLTRLHEVEVDPRGESALPLAWRVDDQGEDEELIVVLSEAPLPRIAALDELEDAARRSRSIWLTRLHFTKESK